MQININRPITPLNRAAKTLLNDVASYSKNLDNSILDFLNIANKKDLQGPGIVSFFSELNELRKDNTRSFCYELIELIEERIKDNPVLKRRADFYMGKLNKKYPKYLSDRLTLANYNCVNSAGVKKQNVWKKMLVSVMNKLR